MRLTASCHCGRVKISVPYAPEILNECHCLLCRRYGVRWAYYRTDEVEMQHAPDATEFYSYGEKNLEFHRCRVCGGLSHWQETIPSEGRVAINARLFEPGEIADVPVEVTDGPPS